MNCRESENTGERETERGRDGEQERESDRDDERGREAEIDRGSEKAEIGRASCRERVSAPV